MKASFRNVTPERLIALLQFIYGPENVLLPKDIDVPPDGKKADKLWCYPEQSDAKCELTQARVRPVRLHGSIDEERGGTSFELSLLVLERLNLFKHVSGDDSFRVHTPTRFFDRVREILGE